jgi:hypothetical protein
MLRVLTLKEAHAASPPHPVPLAPRETIFCKFFGGLECVVHFLVYVAHFVFLRDVWIQTKKAVVADRRASNLATHLPKLATHLPNLRHGSVRVRHGSDRVRHGSVGSMPARCKAGPSSNPDSAPQGGVCH